MLLQVHLHSGDLDHFSLCLSKKWYNELEDLSSTEYSGSRHIFVSIKINNSRVPLVNHVKVEF